MAIIRVVYLHVDFQLIENVLACIKVCGTSALFEKPEVRVELADTIFEKMVSSGKISTYWWEKMMVKLVKDIHGTGAYRYVQLNKVHASFCSCIAE